MRKLLAKWGRALLKALAPPIPERVPDTFCTECRHLVRARDFPTTFRCGAITRLRARDYVTGEEGYVTGNWPRVVSSSAADRHPLCRDVNEDGQCDRYEGDTSDVPVPS